MSAIISSDIVLTFTYNLYFDIYVNFKSSYLNTKNLPGSHDYFFVFVLTDT